MAEYRDHLLGMQQIEDVRLLNKIESHLGGCEECRDRFEKEYPGLLDQQTMDSLMQGPRHLAFCCLQRPGVW
jgi:hypothetical protein